MSAATVLLIEPDARVGREVRMALQGAGYRVTLRSTGTAGLDALRRVSPDLVVMDCDISDLNATRLLREIRRRWRAGIIVVGSPGEPADCIEVLENGADDYLRKPVSPRELTARVGAVMRRVDEERRVWAAAGLVWAAGGGRQLRRGA